MQNLSIKLQIDSETNEAVLFKPTVYGKTKDKEGNEVEQGVNTILVQTVSTSIEFGRVREQVRVGTITVPSLKEEVTKRVLRKMLVDSSYVDNQDSVIIANNNGIDIDLVDNTGYIFLQEFAVPLIPLEKGNTKAFLTAVNASMKKHSKHDTFRYYFENVLRYAVRNTFRGKDAMLQKTLSALENKETLLFDFNNIAKLDPKTQQAIAKEVHKAFFENKNSKLKRAGSDGDYCKVGNEFIFRYTFFTNDTNQLETTEDIVVKHDNQMSLRKANRAKLAVTLAQETDEEDEEDLQDEEVTTSATAEFEE